VDIETATSTSGPWVRVGTRELSTAAADFIRLEGPLLYVAPYATSMSTGTVTVEALGN